MDLRYCSEIFAVRLGCASGVRVGSQFVPSRRARQLDCFRQYVADAADFVRSAPSRKEIQTLFICIFRWSMAHFGLRPLHATSMLQERCRAGLADLTADLAILPSPDGHALNALVSSYDYRLVCCRHRRLRHSKLRVGYHRIPGPERSGTAGAIDCSHLFAWHGNGREPHCSLAPLNQGGKAPADDIGF